MEVGVGAGGVHGIHYDKVYSAVAGWSSIRIILIPVAQEVFKTTKLEYVQAFPQAPIEKEFYLKLPVGFQVEDGEYNEYSLKLHRNIYGQKQAGRVWYKFLTNNPIN